MNEASMIRRFESAKKKRSSWESTWREIFDYTMPGRDGFDAKTGGSREDDMIFDETAVVGVQEFASRMLQGMVPNNMRWARFEPTPTIQRNADEQELTDLQGQLDEVNKVVFEHIQSSNFQQETHEAFLDLSVGTGNLVCTDGDLVDALRFKAVGMHEVYLESGPFGRVDARHRIRNVEPNTVKAIWPKGKITSTPHGMLDGSDEGSTDTFEVLETTVRDWTREDTEVHTHTVIDLKAMETIFSETYEGIGSCPWINFRWSTASGEVYGRGPAYNALAAIKTCNLTVQLILENADMAISGMWQTDDDGVINPQNIRLIPGSIIPRSTNSRGLEALKSAGNFDVAQMVLNDMRHNINRALYNETLGRREGTPISATEVAERMSELSRQVGSAYGRLQQELVHPVIRRVVYLLKRQGRIELPTLNGQEVKITTSSPLLRAQRNEDIQQHINFAGTVGQIFGPQAVQGMISAQRFVDQLARWYEVDKELLTTPDEQQEGAQQAGELMAEAQSQGMDPQSMMQTLLP